MKKLLLVLMIAVCFISIACIAFADESKDEAAPAPVTEEAAAPAEEPGTVAPETEETKEVVTEKTETEAPAAE